LFNNLDSNQVLALLEEIDDDLDELDVLLVKINEATVASDFGIEDRPTLVIFERGYPYYYEGNLHDPEEILEWIMFLQWTIFMDFIIDEILHFFTHFF